MGRARVKVGRSRPVEPVRAAALLDPDAMEAWARDGEVEELAELAGQPFVLEAAPTASPALSAPPGGATVSPPPEVAAALGAIQDAHERMVAGVAALTESTQRSAESRDELAHRTLDVLAELATRPQPAPHVEVTMPAQHFEIHPPEVQAATVHVTVPEQPAAEVTVHVPEQPAPAVTVNVPPPVAYASVPVRDDDGRIVRVERHPVAEEAA